MVEGKFGIFLRENRYALIIVRTPDVLLQA